MKQKFIFTKDPDVAQALVAEGFVQIPTNHGFMFLNEPSEQQKKKLVFDRFSNALMFTDTLCI